MHHRRTLLASLCVLIAVSFCGLSLQAQVKINEVLASNRFNNLDEAGDSSDWIELYNAGASEVNLEGYRLTDDPDETEKWTLPAIVVPPGGYLLVWASGKDIFVPPPEAIEGDSSTLAFDPVFVQDGNHQWSYRVAPGEGSPPSNWASRGFDDSGWDRGAAGFGYGDGDDATLLEVDTPAVFARRTFQVADPDAVSNLVLSINYDDGFIAYINGRRVAAAFAPAGDPSYDSVASGKHEAGTYERFDLTDAVPSLVPGENVIGLVGLNDIPSSDMSLNAELGIVPNVLHTNFELNSDGEQVLLLDPSGTLLDAVVFPEQTE
ncbi:MAG: lamin tail domain-containing protein, partial [Planctomycetota bacterium]